MYIMKLKPALKSYLWGGTRLIRDYGKTGAEMISETWECSVHPDGLSVVTNGKYTGITLAEILSMHPEYSGTESTGEFPVLVKLIDAGKDLSVQVHPDDAYARMHENQNGKSEMWYVLDADENAQIIYGFEENISPETARRSAYDGTIINYLHREKVRSGDVFYIPSGIVHALGKGIVVAEIQENSNVTYRLNDYGRTDENGNSRELHIEKALDVMNLSPVRKMGIQENFPFKTEIIKNPEKYIFNVDKKSFMVLLFTDGIGTAESSYNSVDVKKGECIFIPAGTGIIQISGKTDFIKIFS
ncbi:MAG: class I mannose-6-phosphate isomerase [Muribaculaceae bacterium]|nr:class I mannose-6-phosphate isomerase [Alistipes senegalensis]MCM1473467.1 class I mannose-6-phosphate isomerase [Muribaculaceae bacterium]